MKINILEVSAGGSGVHFQHFEAETTDLMVFIGPDDATKDLICKKIFSGSDYWRYNNEPENGLFPIKQNDLVADLVEWLNSYEKHHLLITTHSPYILTALNNYIYAYQVGQKNPDEVSALIPKHLWIDPKRVSAYFVENGTARSIMDDELQHINAEEIDKASTLTNEMYDKLLDIKVNNEVDEELQHINAEEIDRASDLTNSLHGQLLEIELKDETD